MPACGEIRASYGTTSGGIAGYHIWDDRRRNWHHTINYEHAVQYSVDVQNRFNLGVPVTIVTPEQVRHEYHPSRLIEYMRQAYAPSSAPSPMDDIFEAYRAVVEQEEYRPPNTIYIPQAALEELTGIEPTDMTKLVAHQIQPENPEEGAIWWDQENNELYLWKIETKEVDPADVQRFKYVASDAEDLDYEVQVQQVGQWLRITYATE